MKKILIMTLPQTATVVGGSNSIFFELSNLLANNNYQVTGANFGDIDKRPEKLDSKVNYINLFYYYSKKKQYCEAINAYLDELKPDLIIFFFPYLLIEAKLDSKFNNISKILMFHSRPDYYIFQDINFTKEIKQYFDSTVFQILFPSFYSLLPVELKKERVVCISNPVNIPKDKVDISNEKKKIVYLSRVDNKKGCDFLINSFSKIAKKYPDWKLDIWGQSEPLNYIEKLIKLIKKRKLDGQISFKGITRNPQKTFLDYDFCVFPSLFEGFPLGLIEALSVGLPAIGLKGSSGVNELICEGYNGYLTEYNENKYALKIKQLMDDKQLRDKLSKNAIQSAEKYNVLHFKESWLKIISDILEGRNLENTYASCNKAQYTLFPLSVIFGKDLDDKLEKLSFLNKIFSITNHCIFDRKYKILYIFGLKFIIKRGFSSDE